MRVTAAARRWVRFCRYFFWTVAYRRLEWRNDCQNILAYLNRRVGVERVVIKATNGSTIKNVYVDHGMPSCSLAFCFMVDEYVQRGRFSRMPRA